MDKPFVARTELPLGAAVNRLGGVLTGTRLAHGRSRAVVNRVGEREVGPYQGGDAYGAVIPPGCGGAARSPRLGGAVRMPRTDRGRPAQYTPAAGSDYPCRAQLHTADRPAVQDAGARSPTRPRRGTRSAPASQEPHKATFRRSRSSRHRERNATEREAIRCHTETRDNSWNARRSTGIRPTARTGR